MKIYRITWYIPYAIFDAQIITYIPIITSLYFFGQKMLVAYNVRSELVNTCIIYAMKNGCGISLALDGSEDGEITIKGIQNDTVGSWRENHLRDVEVAPGRRVYLFLMKNPMVQI